MSKVQYEVVGMSHYDEIAALCKKWWYTSKFYKDHKMEYVPDKDTFQKLYEQGVLFALIGKIDGKAVTCFIGVIHPYLFNPSWKTCTELVWCIHPEYQKKGYIVGLLKAIDQSMEALEVNLYNLVLQADPLYESLGDKLQSKYDFVLTDKVFTKVKEYG